MHVDYLLPSIPSLQDTGGHQKSRIRASQHQPRQDHGSTPSVSVHHNTYLLMTGKDKATGRPVLQVYHQESRALIRQIPSKAVLTFLYDKAEYRGRLLSKPV